MPSFCVAIVNRAISRFALTYKPHYLHIVTTGKINCPGLSQLKKKLHYNTIHLS